MTDAGENVEEVTVSDAAVEEVVLDDGAADDGDAVIVGKASAWWILIAGIVGLTASFTLTVEKLELLVNPAYVPSCSLNPVMSCSPVMSSWQASVFGFPNPLIGLMAFSVVITTGMLAIGKVSLPRWYWNGLLIGTVLGAALVHWLIFESLYRIGALCPYCMVVWAMTMTLLVVAAGIALRPLATRNAVAHAIYQWRWPLVVLWFTGLILLILVRFWSYWSTLI
ncbi:hypothetical protein MBRU_18750 [Mycolicibacterium brumae DSM 44177]|nr:hypothetical protein MBRU_18750 [Mycolicibacterium brumae DSM 44177]